MPITGNQHLCYEIRGQAGQYFNFISDTCVSVNAHYVERQMVDTTKVLHVVDEVAIRAVDTDGNCINIRVERNGCITYVNGVATDSYFVAGVNISAVGSRTVVNIPNCGDIDLEMEIICENVNGIDMLRFEVMRGINLKETSHGLLGKHLLYAYIP